jgi:hypothetical protein
MSEPDDRWLLRRERGGDISQVAANTRAAYEQLGELVQELPGEAPSPGWKARLLAAIDAGPVEDRAALRRLKRCRPAWLNMVGVAIAATCAVAIAWCSLASDGRRRVAPGSDSALAVVASSEGGHLTRPTLTRFTTEIRRGTPVRGEVWVERVHTVSVARPADDADRDDVAVPTASEEPPVRREYAHVGDTLILNVNADPALELRVYGDAGEPLAHCTELLDCSLETGDPVPRLRLEVALRSPGRVTAILFARSSIPISFQNLNADLESAHNARRETRRVALVHVD